jgi:hypothetical protein
MVHFYEQIIDNPICHYNCKHIMKGIANQAIKANISSSSRTILWESVIFRSLTKMTEKMRLVHFKHVEVCKILRLFHFI